MTNIESISPSVLDTVTGGKNLAGMWEGAKTVGRGAAKAVDWGMKGADVGNTAWDLKNKFFGGGDDKKDKK